MKNALVFDIETQNIFSDVRKKPVDLDISVIGIYSFDTDEYIAYTIGELDALWDFMRKHRIHTLIGFNNNHFDTPLLNKYAPFNLLAYRNIDILETVRVALGRRLRLDWIAEGTIGVKKSGEGLDAVRWWKEGNIDKIKKYCLDDVDITKRVYQAGLETKKLAYMDLGVKNEFEIDTAPWEEEIEKVVTQSLF